MKRVGSQDYEVVRADFVLTIEIEGFDLAVFQAVPSKVDVRRRDHSQLTTFDLDFKGMATPLKGSWELLDPGDAATPPQEQFAPPVDVFFTFTVGFSTPNGPNPRYEIRLLAASGDKDTRVRRAHQSLTVTTRLDYAK